MPARSATSKRFARERLRLVDLDQRPELISATLATFAACPPGKHHLVCGLPESMGQTPTAADLSACLGVLLASSATELLGAIALCPYSDEQVTLWGPASVGGFNGTAVPERLLTEARTALGASKFTSMRMLVDQRNRDLRAFCLAHGFAVWKDNVVLERPLRSDLPAVAEVRRAATGDMRALSLLIRGGFPETGHLDASLAEREREGYRHYMLTGPAGIIGTAAVRGGARAWLKLIAVQTTQRGQGHGHRLLAGVLHHEAQRGTRTIALEVLADNPSALALYAHQGFKKSFITTIMTAPL